MDDKLSDEGQKSLESIVSNDAPLLKEVFSGVLLYSKQGKYFLDRSHFDDDEKIAKEQSKLLREYWDSISVEERNQFVLTKRHPILNVICNGVLSMANFLIHATSIIYSIFNVAEKDNFKSLFDMYFKKDAGCGLPQDTIFAPSLHIPSGGHCSDLELLTTSSGGYVSCSFTKKQKFNDTLYMNITKGTLFAAFTLYEVIAKKHERTPDSKFNANSSDVSFLFKHSSLHELLMFGFIEKTTYASVFEKLNINNNYIGNSTYAMISNDPIYQVTPKGNGVIFLISDSGDSDKKEDSEAELAREYGLIGVKN